VDPDREPKPSLLEVKKVYQNVGFEAEDLVKGKISILNKFSFISLNNFEFTWEVQEEGEIVQSGTMETLNLKPGEKRDFDLGFNFDRVAGKEYFLNVYTRTTREENLVPKDHVVAKEQFQLPNAGVVATSTTKRTSLSFKNSKENITVNGADFSAEFSKTSGALEQLTIGGQEMLLQGLVPDFWRAPIDNDFGNNLHKRSRVWRKAGERKSDVKMKLKRQKDHIEVKAEMVLNDQEGNSIADYSTTYWVFDDGQIKVTNTFLKKDAKLPEIVRMGMNLQMPREYDQMTWFGRGPQESYWDRKTSAFVGKYSGSVQDQFWAYLRPQENGNKTDVRWAEITNAAGEGLRFVGQPLINTTASHLIMEDLESPERTDGRQEKGVKPVNRHTTDVKFRDLTSVNIDYKQMGVGGDNSWGAVTHPEYRLTEDAYSYSFVIKLLKGN
jgi:beta-galactosidase